MFDERLTKVPQPQFPASVLSRGNCPGITVYQELGAFDVSCLSCHAEAIVGAARASFDLGRGIPVGFISAAVAGIFCDDVEEGALEPWHLVVASVNGDTVFDRRAALEELRGEIRVANGRPLLLAAGSLESCGEAERVIKEAQGAWAERNRNMPSDPFFWGFVSGSLIDPESAHPWSVRVASRVKPEFW